MLSKAVTCLQLPSNEIQVLLALVCLDDSGQKGCTHEEKDLDVSTVGDCNANILACARSKDFAPEAFRLAKEMLDSHWDVFGNLNTGDIPHRDLANSGENSRRSTKRSMDSC